MAEQVLDELRVRATGEKQVGARVPEIVPPNVWQPRTPEQGLEVPVDDVLGVKGCADGGE